MAEWFDNPPILQGAEAEQLQQLYSYLGIMSEKLNHALMSITIEQMTPETQVVIRNAAEGTSEKQLQTTKELIIKTAQVVRTEMEEIRSTLTQTIEAQSAEYGSLYSELENRVTANAEGITQMFSLTDTITNNVGELQADSTNWKRYIKVGVIGENMVGVSIGEDNRVYATFTESALTFYQGDISSPIAYFANDTFYITQGEITNSLTIGNHYWKRLTDGGLALIAGSSGGN